MSVFLVGHLVWSLLLSENQPGPAPEGVLPQDVLVPLHDSGCHLLW